MTPHRWRGERLQGEDGSITPLILGFFLIGLLFVGGSVALADAVTHQRDLQSVCDGAALAAANSASTDAVHGDGTGNDVSSAGTAPTARSADAAIPLDDADAAITRYLGNDPGRLGIEATGRVAADGRSVTIICRHHVHIAFDALIGRSDGIDQTAEASARSPLTP